MPFGLRAIAPALSARLRTVEPVRTERTTKLKFPPSTARKTGGLVAAEDFPHDPAACEWAQPVTATNAATLKSQVGLTGQLVYQFSSRMTDQSAHCRDAQRSPGQAERRGQGDRHSVEQIRSICFDRGMPLPHSQADLR